jgi:DNA-directed RNA polymerase I, II, and III subunit RPABC5
MNCGNVIADKWQYYQRRVKEEKMKRGLETSSQPITIDGNSVPETVENLVLKEMGITRYCCRKHFLTHVDLLAHL